MERVLLYKNMMKVAQRLPEHYKQRYLENANTPLKSRHIIHEEGNWKKVENTNSIYPMKYFNIPPEMHFPKESQACLWAGEGIARGKTEKNDRQVYMAPKYWRPQLVEELFYSEILDRWMLIVVTIRALNIIVQSGGLDEYIIKTSDVDLASDLGLHLKREMLMKLADPGALFVNDVEKKNDLLNRFKDYIIPKEEASWIGYKFKEAIFRQMKNEEISKSSEPLKIRLLNQLVSETPNE